MYLLFAFFKEGIKMSGTAAKPTAVDNLPPHLHKHRRAEDERNRLHRALDGRIPGRFAASQSGETDRRNLQNHAVGTVRLGLAVSTEFLSRHTKIRCARLAILAGRAREGARCRMSPAS